MWVCLGSLPREGGTLPEGSLQKQAAIPVPVLDCGVLWLPFQPQGCREAR